MISCHILGAWSKQKELRSVLIATAKSKETGVRSIDHHVLLWQGLLSQIPGELGKCIKHRAEEMEKVQKSRFLLTDFEMAELAGILWLSAVAEL